MPSELRRQPLGVWRRRGHEGVLVHADLGASRSGRTAQAGHSVFQTTLQNGNPVIHPAVTLTNAALIERTAGDFRFYEDGTPRPWVDSFRPLTGSDSRSRQRSA
jgi:hypothetical protein